MPRARPAKYALATIVCAAAAWLYATPYLVVHGMTAAAKRGDAQAVSEHVDYPAVRESLKAGYRGALARRLGGEANDNPFAALGIAIGNAVVGTMVDALVTPEAIAAMMEGRLRRIEARRDPPAPGQSDEPGAAAQERPAESGGTPTKRSQPAISRGYSGPNTFEIRVSDAPDAPPLVLGFRRHALADWKLVSIALPDHDERAR